MSLPRRLINLAGALLVVVVFVAGTLLFALPVYLQSVEVTAQQLTIEVSNEHLQQQIATLRAQKAQLPQIQKDLASLRAQIPLRAQTDDLSRLVVDSAEAAGVEVAKIDYEEPTVFAANTVQESAPLGAPAAPQANPEGVTGTDQNAAAGSSQDATPAQTQGTAGEDPPREVQIPVTIDVRGKAMDDLSRFLDELRQGPRLLQIESALATTGTGASAGIALTVRGFVFVRIDAPGELR